MENEEKVLIDTQAPVVEADVVETKLEDVAAEADEQKADIDTSKGAETEEERAERELQELQEQINNSEFADTAEEAPIEVAEEKPTPKPEQDLDENRKWKERRVKWEAEAKEQQQKLNEIIQPYGVKDYNEFDKLLEVTFDEVKLKKLEEEAFDKGIDSDFYIQMKKQDAELKLLKAKELARVANAENQRIMQLKIESDIQELGERFPTVKPEALMKNPRFLDYADGKIGSRPLAEIYANFLQFDNMQKPAEEKSAPDNRRVAGAGEGSEIIGLSKEDRMLKNFMERLDPSLKMPDKEFMKYRRR